MTRDLSILMDDSVVSGTNLQNDLNANEKYQQLAASRDGRHWYRVNPGQAFIALGAEDSWEPDFTISVKWSGGTGVQLPAGKHMRIQFQLKKADLYSSWFE